MSVKRYNISKPEEYEVNGEKKTKWHNIGEVVMFEDKGRGLIKIPALSLEAQVFPWKKPEGGGTYQNQGSIETPAVVLDARNQEANPDDIPF